jgi:hypothetical protein
MLKPSVDFSVSCKGDTTGKEYQGLFTVRTALSFRERLREDEIYRTTLGVNPNDASPFSQSVASALSYLAVRITGEVPAFWKECNGGVDLKDDEVLVAVHKAAVEAIDAEYKRFRGEGAEAIKELKKTEPAAS